MSHREPQIGRKENICKDNTMKCLHEDIKQYKWLAQMQQTHLDFYINSYSYGMFLIKAESS